MSERRHPYLSLCLVAILTVPSLAESSSSSPLSDALGQLKKHIDGAPTLTASQINKLAESLLGSIQELGQSSTMVTEAFDLVQAYESKQGPLFVNQATRNGFRRNTTEGIELDRALFVVQQGLIDHAFTPGNVKTFKQILNGADFKSAACFPGAVEAPQDPSVTHEALINASQPAYWGAPVAFAEVPARRPTGCYLAPGSIAEVIVPDSLVDSGFSVRVGAHSWDLQKKPAVKRLDRVSIVYPIEEKRTFIANPLGGGIYIEVPYLADAGVVKVSIKNAVRSPCFSARSFQKTGMAQWRKTERHHPAPWTDFESDKFMMQVPTSWISELEDPGTLMRDWDKSMDVVSDLFGLPHLRPKTVLYLQVDVTMRGGANFPGYPQSNYAYDPRKNGKGERHLWLLKGPQHASYSTFHELGHAHFFTKFRGEVEAVVNLPFVAVLNKGFGVDLDTAFGRSMDDRPQVSLDQAAITWMVTENFRQGNPMDISNRPGDEVKYQHRGYGKYVEIANLFGWDALGDFWHSVNQDYLKGIRYSRNSDRTNSRILRMSKAAGVDLRPLIHFWGVQPRGDDALEKDMQAAGLEPSPLIYDRLVHYKSVIPMSNAAFAEHANTVYPRRIGQGRSPLYGEGWYYVWLPKYQDSHGVAAQAALQNILDRYFPNGRPSS